MGFLGFFDFIAKPILTFLIILYDFLWQQLGLAIIALTIVVRVALLYLSIRQLRASRTLSLKNREMQPKIQALKARYGKDKRKLNEETMKLFQEEGFNPLGGCLSAPMLLPMLIQMPIWIGLYRAIILSVTPEYMLTLGRTVNDGFLWLSLAERDPYFIMPVLVAFSMWISQEMSTLPSGGGDAQQDTIQNMMRFTLPLMFGVICINFPSGLALFWVVSSIIQGMTGYPMYGWRGSKVLRTASIVPDMSTLGPDVDVSRKKDKLGRSRERKAPAPGKHIPDVTDPGRALRREERKKDGAVGNRGKDSGRGGGAGSGTTGSQ